MMDLDYSTEKKISPQEFIDLLKRSTLSERRPIEDINCITGMLNGASLLVTAWDRGLLVGVARSITDFCYACYLSDLAVDSTYQKKGIGKKLIFLTQEKLAPKCSLILLSAPTATQYYPRIGFAQHPSAWILKRNNK